MNNKNLSQPYNVGKLPKTRKIMEDDNFMVVHGRFKGDLVQRRFVDTFNTLDELGDILKIIHRRMISEGYEIIDGKISKKYFKCK